MAEKEYDDEGNEIAPPPPPPVPPMTTRRMGKKWRIIYSETKNLAFFNSGRPVDGGGFLDEYVDGKKTIDGQLLAQQQMVEAVQGAAATGQQSRQDPEAEGIGN